MYKVKNNKQNQQRQQQFGKRKIERKQQRQ
jgi:hypothetical protein